MLHYQYFAVLFTSCGSVNDFLCDVLFFADEEMKDELAGSTANIVIIKDSRAYCVGLILKYI